MLALHALTRLAPLQSCLCAGMSQVHNDLKSKNILLSEDYVIAKIGAQLRQCVEQLTCLVLAICCTERTAICICSLQHNN